MPSLSSVANRYIQLTPGPNNKPSLSDGATLPASATREVTDLDQLFNTLDPKTRKGLQEFIQGSAQQYVGAGKQFGESTEYFAPFLSASNHFFSELVRDQPTFTKFLVETSKAVTTIGARKEALSDLIENADTTFQAIGSAQSQFAAGLKQLPLTLQAGNKTFAELPSTFQALTELVEASKPTSKPLTSAVQQPPRPRRHGHDACHELRQRLLQARRQQRPDRPRQGPPGALQAARHSLAGSRHRREGIGSDHRVLRPLRAGSRRYAEDLRAVRRLLRRQRRLRPRQPRPAELRPLRKHAHADDAPNRHWRTSRPASCDAARAGRPSLRPTGPRRSPTPN